MKNKKRKNQTSVCTDTWDKLFYQRKMQISICRNKISNAPDNEKSHKRCPNEKERQMNLRHFNLFKAPAGSALLDNSYVRGLMVSSSLLCFHLVDLYLSPCNAFRQLPLTCDFSDGEDVLYFHPAGSQAIFSFGIKNHKESTRSEPGTAHLEQLLQLAIYPPMKT